MNNRALLILAIVVIGVVAAALSFLNTKPAARPPQTVVAPSPAPARDGVPPVRPPVRPRRDLPPPVPEKVVAVPKATPRPLEAWEYKIDEVLRSNADEAQTAQILINMLPTLPPDGQAEAAQHISNLLLDKDYNKVLPLIKNPNLSEEVLDVFVTDLMNRDDATKLPTLLEIAKIPNHPHREEALTDLEIFLDEDFSNDPVALQAGVRNYLLKQAAEEAAEEAAAPRANVRNPGGQ